MIGEPYYHQEVLPLCVGVPIKQNGAVIRYLIGSYKYDILNDVLSMLILGHTGSACIVNQEGEILGNSQPQNIYQLYSSAKNKV